MSNQLINLNPDLKKLRDKRYNVTLSQQAGVLVVKDVPYVNSGKKIKWASLVSTLDLNGDVTKKPSDHTVYFTGEYPCDFNGSPIKQIENNSEEKTWFDGCVTKHRFSSKPESGYYDDYFHKMTNYINIISNEAKAIDPSVDAKTSPVIASDNEDSPFVYVDTASSRAGISDISSKLESLKIAIIGVGGTGSYILDLVAKTPVKEIHIYDSDEYSSHNAFRAPGAASIEQLRTNCKKVDYFKETYSNMKNGIVAHNYQINSQNIDELKDMDFVFISIDSGKEKKLIFEKLEEFNVPFIDAGLSVSVNLSDDSNKLQGMVRTNTSTQQNRCDIHNDTNQAIFYDDKNNDEYNQNIQIADLNALNAVMAVIKWKKIFGFYLDMDNEHSSFYTINANLIRNADYPKT